MGKAATASAPRQQRTDTRAAARAEVSVVSGVFRSAVRSGRRRGRRCRGRRPLVPRETVHDLSTAGSFV